MRLRNSVNAAMRSPRRRWPRGPFSPWPVSFAREQRFEFAGAMQGHHVVVAADVVSPMKICGTLVRRVRAPSPSRTAGSVSTRTSVQSPALALQEILRGYTQYAGVGQIAVV